MESTRCPKELFGLRDYEILEKIAEGSMASVYKARRLADKALVAIKVPLPAVVNNSVLRERFRQEFSAGKRLNHPNIVRTLDFGQTRSTFYLVLEFVTGQDLWQRIRNEGRLPEREAVRIITEAALGLHEAHQHGIIHRDVKPDNILLTAEGQAKLGDLGLIKELESDAHLTCPQKGLGTPNFMSPEQFTEARNADVRCDVYSLGATLYMTVTGMLPFQAKTMSATLRKKLNNDLKPPREIVPTLSEAVDWAIRRAVQIDPQCRHASCLEFVEALKGENKAVANPGPRSPSKRPPHTQEKRRAIRYPCTVATLCELLTSIHPEETTAVGHWPGQVLNLSATGLGLLLGRRFEPGTVVAVVLESSTRTFQVRADVRVIRSLPAEGTQWFLGAAFNEPLAKETVQKLLWAPSESRH
jgi:serine/threonine protein kinase